MRRNLSLTLEPHKDMILFVIDRSGGVGMMRDEAAAYIAAAANGC